MQIWADGTERRHSREDIHRQTVTYRPTTASPFVFDPLGGVNPNEPIDGVPAGDVAKFVQGNTQYYIPTFLGLSRFKRNRFNFSAFFFTGIWMLYRKLYKIGTIMSVLARCDCFLPISSC